jgi:hypothetical protein
MILVRSELEQHQRANYKVDTLPKAVAAPACLLPRTAVEVPKVLEDRHESYVGASRIHHATTVVLLIGVLIELFVGTVNYPHESHRWAVDRV